VFVVSGEVKRGTELADTPPLPVFSKDVILWGLSALLFQGCESKRVRFTAAVLQFRKSIPSCKLAGWAESQQGLTPRCLGRSGHFGDRLSVGTARTRGEGLLAVDRTFFSAGGAGRSKPRTYKERGYVREAKMGTACRAATNLDRWG
jgi:hypothetical protein